MKKINLTNLLYNLLVCAVVCLFAVPVIGAGGYLIAGAMFLYGLMPVRLYPDGVLRNEVISRVFSRDLQEKLYPNNSFYKGAQVDTGIVLDAETIEVPQDEDGEAQIVVNPKSFPLETYAEEDKKKQYTTDLIATKPQLVTDLNQALVSYDKRAAKLRKHMNSLNTQIADRIMYGWMPTNSDFIFQTTSNETRPAKAPGATGNRKRLDKKDIFKAFSMLNDLDVPLDGQRRLVLPAYMYEDLLLIEDFIDADKLRMRGDLSAGQVGEVLGFKVFMRSKTTIFTEAANPQKKPIGAAPAQTDNQAALFFHPSFVRYAEGVVKVYVNPDRGEYLGGTMNAAVRGGSMISRLSEIGVGAIVEDNA